MHAYQINHDAIRRDVYRRFRKYIWFGLHFLLMMIVITLDISFFDSMDSPTPFTMIVMLSWMMHFPYLVLMILRERAVQKAIERERKMYYQTLQKRTAPQYDDAAIHLSSDGELIETVDDYFYDEKPKHFAQN